PALCVLAEVHHVARVPQTSLDDDRHAVVAAVLGLVQQHLRLLRVQATDVDLSGDRGDYVEGWYGDVELLDVPRDDLRCDCLVLERQRSGGNDVLKLLQRSHCCVAAWRW